MPAHLESLFTTDLDNLRQDFRPAVVSLTGLSLIAGCSALGLRALGVRRSCLYCDFGSSFGVRMFAASVLA